MTTKRGAMRPRGHARHKKPSLPSPSVLGNPLLIAGATGLGMGLVDRFFPRPQPSPAIRISIETAAVADAVTLSLPGLSIEVKKMAVPENAEGAKGNR